jgi:hypothetical protein
VLPPLPHPQGWAGEALCPLLVSRRSRLPPAAARSDAPRNAYTCATPQARPIDGGRHAHMSCVRVTLTLFGLVRPAETRYHGVSRGFTSVHTENYAEPVTLPSLHPAQGDGERERDLRLGHGVNTMVQCARARGVTCEGGGGVSRRDAGAERRAGSSSANGYLVGCIVSCRE